MIRGRLRSLAAPAPPLDDDNLLVEILLRLPPRPSSLPRASLVCKRWRHLVSEPHFLRRFRSHHRKAPLLGFFHHDFGSSIGFISVLDSPDRIPEAHFSLHLCENNVVLGCRHGLVLVLNRRKDHLYVCDPVTGVQRHVALPPAFNETRMYIMDGAVLCAAKDQDHVHGACHSEPFQVILVGEDGERIRTSVYSSETGAWGNLASTMWGRNIRQFSPCSSILVGNSIFWLVIMERAAILQFDLDRQNLAYVDVPSDAFDLNSYFLGECQFSIAPADSGSISFIVLAGFSVRIWRTSNGDGIARWMLGNTIELSSLLSLRPAEDKIPVIILGLDEDGSMLFKLRDSGVIFLVHLESMQVKELSRKVNHGLYYPFASFYGAGT